MGSCPHAEVRNRPAPSGKPPSSPPQPGRIPPSSCGKSLRMIAKPPRLAHSACGGSEDTLGDGTYGPVPQKAVAGGKSRREPIPFNVAFAEIVHFVTRTLNESGEQWSEQSRQDLVSTVLISAGKQGLLGVWER